MPEDTYLSSLKQRHDFASWAQARRLDAELHVWHFAMDGSELSAMEPARIEPPATTPAALPVPLRVAGRKQRAGAAARAAPREATPEPRLLTSFWRPMHASRALINVEVYECASRLAAHELLLHVLGGFQSTQLMRRDDLNIGDVAFAMPGGAALVFARGNLVQLVRNASRDTQDVTQIARQLDGHLISRQPAGGRRMRVPQESTGRHRLSMPSAQEAAEAPLYLKLFSNAGTFTEQGDEIVLHPVDEKGPYDLDMVAVYRDRRQLQRALRVGQTAAPNA
jgi:hypothetical protein